MEHGSQDEVCLICLNKISFISFHETVLVNDCDMPIHNHSRGLFLVVGIFYLTKLNKSRHDSNAQSLEYSIFLELKFKKWSTEVRMRFV